MTSTRPPTGLEHKAAAALLEPRPAPGGRTGVGTTEVNDETGTVEALVAVSGCVDDVGDVIRVGAMARSLRERTPRLVVGHDWNRVCGKVLAAVELLPGDPRLPRTAPDGRAWPSEAGALWVRARYLLGTREGREQYEIAKAFGPDQSFSIGYRVADGGAQHKGGIRYIRDLSIFEASPVLFGANRWAHQLSVKSAGGAPVIETKATTAVTRRLFSTLPCSVCGRPAAAPLRPLPDGTKLVCAACVAEVDRIGTDAGYLDADDVAAAQQLDELTPQQEYAQAVDDEREHHLNPDGTLARGPYSAWSPDRGAARRP